MERNHDVIEELAAVTTEMAEMPDLGDRRLTDLIEQRGMLIRRMIADRFDGDDPRFPTIVAAADRLQERLQKRAASIRWDLTSLNATGALISAVRSTIAPVRPQNGLDMSA